MKVFFKCKASGNLVSFVNETDIEWMRKDEQYEEIKNENESIEFCKETSESIIGCSCKGNNKEGCNTDEEENTKVLSSTKVTKKRGRKPNLAK